MPETEWMISLDHDVAKPFTVPNHAVPDGFTGSSDNLRDAAFESLMKGGTRMSISLWQDISSISKALGTASLIELNSLSFALSEGEKVLLLEVFPSSETKVSMLLRTASTST